MSLLLTASTLLAALQEPAPERVIVPPSTVLVPGGNTTIGSTREEILALLKEAPQHQPKVRSFDAETPQHRLNVPDFHLMVTEVTNEQFLAFVVATGFPPPILWADKAALTRAHVEHARAEQEKIDAAERENRQPPERTPLDETAWWERNWSKLDWRMPEELQLAPVVYVDHAEALAYCHWAGMRLPSEVEFQRAVRGNGKDPYPWGEEWMERVPRPGCEAAPPRAALSDVGGLNAPVAVGSYPAGISEQGVFDLIGNVWEWTSSRYAPFAGFEANEYRVGKGRDDVLTPTAIWDDELRIAAGGSFEMDHWVARATVRRGTSRSEKTLGLGFRCAATARAGLDTAGLILESHVPRAAARVKELAWASERAFGIDSWTCSASSAPGAPPGYAVVHGYRHVVFVPVEKLSESQPEPLARASLIAPFPFGLLSTSERLLAPALEPGLYLLSYRAAGRAPRERLEPDQVLQVNAIESVVDVEHESVLFHDAYSGELVASRPVALCEFDDAEDPGSFSFGSEVVSEDAGSAPVGRLALDACVDSSLRGRVLRVVLELEIDSEAAASSWRR